MFSPKYDYPTIIFRLYGYGHSDKHDSIMATPRNETVATKRIGFSVFYEKATS